MKKKIQLISLLVIGFLVASSLSTTIALAEGGNQTDVGKNQYKGSIAGNSTNQFTFRNKFQFQIRTNQSIGLDMDVDVDAVGERDFQLDMNCSEEVNLSMQIRADNSDLGLTNGTQIQSRNQNRYRYQQQFMVNFSLNESCELKTQLRLKTMEQNATWAYYDEQSQEFVAVETTYENGELIANSDHFSIWTVLSGIDDTAETSEPSAIPGYALLGVFGLIGMAGLVLFTIKKRRA